MTTTTATPASFDGTSGTGASWSNASNAAASDDSYATVQPIGGQKTRYLTGTMGANAFSVPSDATIDGVVFSVEMKSSGNNVDVWHVYILDATGARCLTDKATGSVPTSDTVRTYGGAGDTWGESLTPAWVNDADFGAAIAFDNGAAGVRTISVDTMDLTIYYTEPGGLLGRGPLRGVLRGVIRAVRVVQGWLGMPPGRRWRRYVATRPVQRGAA